MSAGHHSVGQSVHPSPQAGAIAGYRTFVAIVAVNYFTLIALTPRAWGAKPSFWPLAILSVLYLALGIWGFEFAQRVRGLGRRFNAAGSSVSYAGESEGS